MASRTAAVRTRPASDAVVSPRAPALAALAIAAVLAILAAVWIPWAPEAAPWADPAIGAGSFDAEARGRAAALAAAVDLPVVLRWILPPAVALAVLWLARGSWGARRGARWWLPPATLLAVVAATLPGAWGIARARRDAGLDIGPPAEHLVRVLVEAGLTVVAGSLLAWLAVALWRRWPRRWWIPAAGIAAAAVALGSLVLPQVDRVDGVSVDPVLRDSVVSLADAAGVDVGEVVVVDVSDRTTTVNAIVSGWGPTRQVAFTDTLAAAAGPEELGWIAAHELSHVRNNDVPVATLFAALGAALAIACAGVLLAWAPSRRWLRVDSDSGGRVGTTLIVMATLLIALSSPVSAWMSRSVEIRADREATALMGSTSARDAAVRIMAERNASALEPPRWRYAWGFTHPTPGQRLALDGPG